MAAPGKKKLVQQDELRRLMKAKQRETASKKRVDSPLAKYNSLGHLSCAVCNVPIKSELLWQAHILGKQHKEKVAGLKGTKENTSSPSVSAPTSQATKRKGPVAGGEDVKRVRDSEEQSSAPTTASTLPAGFFEKTDQPSHKQTTGNSASLRLLAGDYDDDDEEVQEKGETSSAALSSSMQKSTEIPLPPPTANDGLPADFFDRKTTVVSHSGSIFKADIQEKLVERKENTAEALPEGFFDDPEVDAKVRKVDAPKDHMAKEWEEFQKEIRQVNTVSEAIVAEEDEEGRFDRQIEEIDEQMECFRRIEHLRNRKDVLNESLKKVLMSKAAKEEDDAESNDEEMLPVIIGQNWREKGAFL
ncbi:PREDICTED: zinc finger protein 830 [Nanorana parkeri]|uniref:zinc finger protein 830 n=1 Tax=Nanorana parkeri TaxID=125878 RepID=UPI000854A8B2|nr:PREDICTED: zinc finger protein 830 [Nanorana parkeri]